MTLHFKLILCVGVAGLILFCVSQDFVFYARLKPKALTLQLYQQMGLVMYVWPPHLKSHTTSSQVYSGFHLCSCLQKCRRRMWFVCEVTDSTLDVCHPGAQQPGNRVALIHNRRSSQLSTFPASREHRLQHR